MGRTGPCTSPRAIATAAAGRDPATTASSGLSKPGRCIRFAIHLMELAEVVGQLAGLRRFPVTSLGGESIDECRIQGLGLVGDRIFDVFDDGAETALSEQSAPFLLRYRARYLDSMVRGGD